MIASILLRAGVLVKYILSAPFREIRTRPACAIKDCGRVPRNLVAYAMKKARSLLQNFGQLKAKTADKFLVSSILSAKQKQPFYIYEYASPNPGVWAAKNPDKIGVYAEHIFFMFLLWRRKRDSNSRAGHPTYALSRGASSPA